MMDNHGNLNLYQIIFFLPIKFELYAYSLKFAIIETINATSILTYVYYLNQFASAFILTNALRMIFLLHTLFLTILEALKAFDQIVKNC